MKGCQAHFSAQFEQLSVGYLAKKGFASKTSVKIPAAKGAAQDFPENDVTHLLNKKVV